MFYAIKYEGKTSGTFTFTTKIHDPNLPTMTYKSETMYNSYLQNLENIE